MILFAETVMINKIKGFFIELSLSWPKTILLTGFIITLLSLGAIPKIKTDTDPVHMLPENNPAVMMHNKVKKDFQISDMVALGIRSKNGETLFTKDMLSRVKLITDEILKIKDTDGSDIFIPQDLMSISTIDDIVVNENNELLVRKLMPSEPHSDIEALSILKKLNSNPMLSEKVTSLKGDLIGIFIPLVNGKKDRSYFLGQKIKEIAKSHLTDREDIYFAGLPMAETTFGNEMFTQMAVYAPMAGLVIFLLLLLFFKSLKLVIAPMILAMMAVIWSMAGLVYSGNVIHIMSSMIPIFIMPIAVLDSVHILSVLSEKIGHGYTKKEAIKHTIEELFNPMFYTSLTTVIGFASLATTGIPPVIVFGITVAFGVMMSFILTILFIPAYTMLVSEKTLEKFGVSLPENSPTNVIARFFKKISYKNSKMIIASAVILFAIAIIGIQKIIINDNPVRWFKKGHELRVADVEMNKALAGTYMTNLVFSFHENKGKEKKQENTDDFSDFEVEEELDLKTIKDPQVINYISKVSDFLKNLKGKRGEHLIGGTTSIVDLLSRVGEVAFKTQVLPETREKVSQYMFLFESGDIKKGRDMWRLITSGDSKLTQMWIHFKSGDNQNMSHVMEELDQFMKQNPPPVVEGETLQVNWSGLMHINHVWQETMVRGMGESLVSSFVIVFFMMILLFRSIKWSIIAMLPLSLTIALIYGLIGFSGKFYDMPIAVLSSLTLGLSIDFAIHFIEHAQFYNKKNKNFQKTFDELFNGTAQAIWRNVLVIAVGFTPLFFASLQPYFTVGMFFFLIMLLSGFSTLLLLPAILKEFYKKLPGFKEYL